MVLKVKGRILAKAVGVQFDLTAEWL